MCNLPCHETMLGVWFFKQTSAAKVVESNVPSPWATLCDQFEKLAMVGFFRKHKHDPEWSVNLT